MERVDQRSWDEMRYHRIVPDYVRSATGSCLIEFGGTRVICTASVESGVPAFLKGKGEGWLTAEYAMLPASTGKRKPRDGLKKDGRGVEISRLIGRALRQAVDRRMMGEYTVTVDCDVLEADGGTRTAAITGGFVALCCAADKMLRTGAWKESPIRRQVAAVSAGIVEQAPLLDLCYLEDSAAQVDMNFVMDDLGCFIEIQGTGEGRPFRREEMESLITLAESGAQDLMALQRDCLGKRAKVIAPPRKLVVASNNDHKLREIRTLLGDRYQVMTMGEAGFTGEIEENGSTFEENALIKARTVCGATGLCTVADDSGLMVDVLGGEPGVRSARYAGEHGNDAANNRKLIDKLWGVPDEERSARFLCAMALVTPDGRERTVTGECPGYITHEARGDGGFGYDPFFETATGETFAEMDQEEKNRISHRARAAAEMLPVLEEELG